MQVVSCPTCGNSFPASDGYCARCREVTLVTECIHTPEQELDEAAQTLILPRKWARRDAETPQEASEATLILKRGSKGSRRESAPPLELSEPTQKLLFSRKKRRADLGDFDATLEEDQDDEFVERHETWQKFVEHKTPHALPAITRASLKKSRQPFLAWRSPRMFFWLSLVLILAVLLGGGFGMAISFGRTIHSPAVTEPALQVSPATIALGGIVTLRGTHFTPGGTIELSRDARVALADTGGLSSVRADARGSFSDTVIVDPVWLAGPHMLYALDVRTHRQAVFKILVTGQNALQGPPHMLLSANTLNLGAGDEAMNGSKLLAISNAGGGLLIWQASVGSSWLQITPKSGSIASGGHISAMVAVDRAGLAPGDYQTSIVFVSNTGQVTLDVSMRVTALQPGHEAIMQVSSAALTFTATAGASDPQAQALMVGNPGVQTLNWGASVSLQSGSGWLWVTPSSGSIQPGEQQRIFISASIQDLAPGIYKGAILFVNQGSQPIQGGPQSVYVSLTITPPCTLTFAPGSLSFTGEHGQASPPAQALHIDVAQGCSMSQDWEASVRTSTGGTWLSLDHTSATTPSTVQVSVNTAGLAPGTYNGTLTFSVNTGPQIVPVILTITPIPCTISAPATLTLQGTAGQTSPAPQSITVSANGDCSHTLNWSSMVAVNSGNWLSATPSGTLTQPSTASLNVQASLSGLSAGSYPGTVTITAVDSTTGKTVGTAQTSVTLTVAAPPPPCALQVPSPSTLNIAASVGSTTPQTASFTIAATGTCSGNVTITPSVDAGSAGWASVSSAASIASGGSTTFTVTINPGSLTAGTYTSTITLTAADGNGAIAGSPQTVTVSLTVS